MSQFEGFEERSAACAVCEAMLPEAVDGMLSETEQIAFDKHVAGCMECARELAEARRGAAWLSMLKSQAPEPPVGLLAKILAETTGTSQAETAPVAAPISVAPVWEPEVRPLVQSPRGSNSAWATVRKFWSGAFPVGSTTSIFQPRFAMTAAMAFFSIALTLNLTGVRLRDLRASNFTPSALKRTVADMDASATRMFQNNRAVYQVESRLSELSNNDAMNDASPAGRR
ncbi:MAG: zf-HC2 domain-containing protein [Acidobacteriaceae bacterium]